MNADFHFHEPPKKLMYILMAILLVYSVVRSVAFALGKPFWYDEMLTLITSSQGSWNAIVKALLVPTDGQPPLFHWTEHIARGLLRNPEVALRLPSIMGLPCTLLCVFVFVKRRGGRIVALVCAVMLLMTEAFQYYAAEARPYGMVMACIAFAMVCYQRVPSLRWTVLLAMSLTLAESLHYLAVLAMIPFGLAEMVVFLKTKKFRWPVWGALAVGAVPLLIFWRLLMINKMYYGPHFWARMKFTEIPRMYGEFFMTDGNIGAGIAAAALAGVLMRRENGGGVEGQAKELAEEVLSFTLAALPFIGYILLVRIAHSGLTARYLLPTVLGVVTCFGYILSRARLRTIGITAVFILSAVSMHELHFWRFFRSDIQDLRSIGPVTERLIKNAGHDDLPVIFPDGTLLLPLTHYVAPPVAKRFRYVKQDLSEEHWADTVDKGFEALQPYIYLPVSDVASLVSTRRDFLIYVEEKDWYGTWLINHLRQQGWTVQNAATNGYRRVYYATLNAR
jgi:hypothetical protein